MTEDRRVSGASQSSLISYRSVEHQNSEIPERHGEGSGTSPENGSPSSVSPSRHRVHFGADLRYEYGDADTESESSQGHSRGSVDITEARPRRGTAFYSPSGGTEREDCENGSAHSGPGASFRNRVTQLQRAVSEKARDWATRLGRLPSDEEDVRATECHEEGGNGDGLSEKYDHELASSEAHRLVREMSNNQSGYRPGHDKLLPHKGPDYWGNANNTWDGPGTRRRSSTGGVLSHLLKLNGALDNPQFAPSITSQTGTETPLGASTPGTTTPRKRKWYKKPSDMSPTNTLAATTTISGASTPVSSEVLTAASKRRSKQSRRSSMRLEDEIQITLEIAQIIARERYIMQLCKALMLFGAPTHRLEEYMQMTAKVLEVDSQYLYVPGCMIMSFDDPSTRTAEVKLVRVSPGVDLGRLSETHNVYKNVVHDVIGIEEAIQELEDIVKRKPRYNKLIIVLVCGLATSTVGPFAFGARPIDMPIIFCNGCLLSIMQHVIAPRSMLYTNVFEVTAAVLTSFIARAIGSITTPIHGTTQYLFCFSAIAQSSIALILPGYTVLCSSLELQSQKIVPGSIRMVYAIIYSLFLGYGITVGTTIYGLIDRSATSNTTCPPVLGFPNPYVARFPFVIAFSICLLIINQGKWKQGPVMVVIAFAGYVTNYFVTKRLGTNTQVANTVGAFAIGVMGNLYSRLWHGHAATAILPGIFVLVPSGLAASGSLIAGVESADEIRSNVTSNSSQGTQPATGSSGHSSVQDLGFGMVQVAIGITVGLFLAALVVYPLGKRRSGLFSF
ncbi:hypothetical protein BDV28DRAFT_161863 [Aspergillus coremiiformis]|uniref:DUF1212-domain-containing protein n=1 Tax=Aspergillus coremiiformis TaxID=138285 RepID=A0A5N6Z3Q6_9EURO|nr:hypothetical protein BDV28DRAFT_161863 [Aspergillus coremiiformis]